MRKNIWITGGVMAATGLALVAFQNCASSSLPGELNQAQQATVAPDVVDSQPNVPTTPAPAQVPPLELRPSSSSLAATGTQSFGAFYGQQPYTYSVSANCGAINGSTGAYVAPDATAECVITVTDGVGTTASARVSSTKAAPPPAKMAVSPVNPAEGQMMTLSSTGGSGSYTYSLSNAGNAMIAGNVITARTTAGPMTITMSDGTQTDQVTVQVPPDAPTGHESLCTRCAISGTVMSCDCTLSIFGGGVQRFTIDFGACVHSKVIWQAAGRMICRQ